MPTLRKNRPSRMPRNGSTSASSWWRKVDSESSTPARKAPIAIDSPPTCMSERGAEHDEQRRRGHHLARLGGGEDAEHRVEQPAPGGDQRRDRGEADRDRRPAGRDERRLGRRRAPGRRRARAAARSPDPRAAGSTMIRRPGGMRRSSPRSSSICMTIAVEVSTKPVPAIEATARADSRASSPTVQQQQHADRRPARSPARRSRSRIAQSRDGCISSPMTNRNITTPSSATCRIACGSVKSPRPNGPIDEAGGEIAEHRAEAEPLEERHRDDRRRQQHHDRARCRSHGRPRVPQPRRRVPSSLPCATPSSAILTGPD